MIQIYSPYTFERRRAISNKYSDREESLRLNELNSVCTYDKRGSPIIPWNHVDDPSVYKLIYRYDILLHEEISSCPAIDVYMARG